MGLKAKKLKSQTSSELESYRESRKNYMRKYRSERKRNHGNKRQGLNKMS